MQNADLIKQSGTLLYIKFFFSYIEMSKEALTFGNIKIEKNKFSHHKS